MKKKKKLKRHHIGHQAQVEDSWVVLRRNGRNFKNSKEASIKTIRIITSHKVWNLLPVGKVQVNVPVLQTLEQIGIVVLVINLEIIEHPQNHQLHTKRVPITKHHRATKLHRKMVISSMDIQLGRGQILPVNLHSLQQYITPPVIPRVSSLIVKGVIVETIYILSNNIKGMGLDWIMVHRIKKAQAG